MEGFKNKEQEPSPKDISKEFLSMEPHEFDDFLFGLMDEPSLSIKIDWKDVLHAWALKAFVEDFSFEGQKRSATIKATEEQYKQAPNVFASGVKWEKV